MRAAIALGSNLGSRLAYLRAAVDALGAILKVVARSRVYSTRPVPAPQPDYLNAALLVETTRTPEALLGACMAIESSLGRSPGPRWGPRVIDLDLVQADVAPVSATGIVLPHPEAARRAFVLAPCADVWADMTIGGHRVTELLAAAGGPPGPSIPFTPEPDVEVLDHTADVSLRVVARDEADLLAASGDALTDLILDRGALTGRERIDVEVEGAEPEDRVVALLSEIVGRFDAESFVPRRTLVRAVDGTRVRASLWGERFDPARHAAKTAVKAATYHGLHVERTAAGLACTITLDL